MMRLTLAILLMIEFCSATRIMARETALLEKGMAVLENGYQAWDAGQFKRSADIFSQAMEADPEDALAAYWLGVACFHSAMYYFHGRPGEQDPAQGEKAVDAGRRALQRALTLKPDDSESCALLGVLHGMKIRLHFFEAFTLGPQVERLRSQALQLNPDNPRVHYLTGVSFWFTPEMFGGGAKSALPHLLQAEKAYAAEALRPAMPLEPRWGHGTCLAFIGEVYAKQGDQAQAVLNYQKALAIHPQEPLALEGLKKIR